MEQKQVISYQLELFDINGEGVVYPFLEREAVVDIDLKNFFDVVNYDRLMYRLSTRIGDKSLLKLIIPK